ncbi:Vesicle transport protein Sec22A [Monocercomonoides exilis]|uniref:Vesicle transport protein Sec22A n=1 Tax=Monocercomonoides exilis TaxID=2049356 RepID=UPI003559D914|nr:Vesicle transport protein Sec22A [Monocercomonoides exilis]|eukprot:MONOS_16839.1-p1 / transcript=MONOS_16839.1 / gene=MONOS_16839 / organism=Monocercomonoides_exilis_PA203 / gene_product= Vesicle transport protein Sec22A / transcript_product= Vesicle transport protein Sec22A / location=Mono_scaffold00050:7534-8323(+) / protein_length=217 / sequence_SO=supercontig / SO=protein_coding / is_pseudo=false
MTIYVTFISRLSDGLILAGSMMDDTSYDLEPQKNKAKQILKTLTFSSPKQLAIEEGRFIYYYSIDHNVVFLALCSSSFPRSIAFSYLEDISRDFLRLHATEIEAAIRPFAFVSYDMEMEKKRRRYCEMKQQHKLDELNEELKDVRGVLTKSLEDVIGRGEKIDVVTQLSTNLVADSKSFRNRSIELSKGAGIRQYVPYAVVVLGVALGLFLRAKLF